MNALIILSVIGFIALLSEIFNFRKFLSAVVLTGIAIAFIANACEWNTAISYYHRMMVFDNYAVAFTGVILLVAFLWFILSPGFFKEETSRSDHFTLILFSLAGAVVMISYANMTMLFLGIEILSIPMYVLAGSKKSDLRSNEAAVKYFLLGAFATCFLLFGIALIYGATGSFDLAEIRGIGYRVTGTPSISLYPISSIPLFYGGVIMMMVGLAFKISAVPFHFWTPDVYDGSPDVITAFMATIVKTAAFAAFFRLFFTSFTAIIPNWSIILWVMAILTIITGNLTAVFQHGLKRMLAYSSIAHAGYMLLALIAMNNLSQSSLLLYTASYSIATIAAFAVMIIVINKKGNDDFDSFRGLAKNNPFVALVMCIAMFSLAGIPPTAGFFAKYFIFSAAMQSHHIGLVIIAVAGSLVGVYYYFRVVIAMFQGEEEALEKIMLEPSYKFLLFITSLIIIILGLFPSLLINLLH